MRDDLGVPKQNGNATNADAVGMLTIECPF
jgi:hypothetical protein